MKPKMHNNDDIELNADIDSLEVMTVTSMSMSRSIVQASLAP